MKELKANGIVTCGGGEYNSVNMEGIVTVMGAITCDKFNLEGIGKIKGDIEACSVKIAGTCKIEGDLKADKVDVFGLMNVKGKLIGDMIDIDGALEVAGEISADKFSLLMAHGSEVQEILGQSCLVKKGKGSIWSSILKPRKHELTCQNIECDDIYLEYCSVHRVSGQRVTIGPKCRIGSLEYTESYSVHDSAKVGDVSKRSEKA